MKYIPDRECHRCGKSFKGKFCKCEVRVKPYQNRVLGLVRRMKK